MNASEGKRIIRKNREDYNRIAKYFAKTRKEPWAEFELFRPYVKKGQNILDWGCGNGRLARWLKDFNVKYFGEDHSAELLKIAGKSLRAEIKKGDVKFFNTAKKIKIFPDGFFDVIFAVASFHHLPDAKSRLEILCKFYRELKKGGKLFITVWNLNSDWSKKKNDFEKIGENDFLVPWKNPDGRVEVRRYYHSFKKTELSDLIREAGFQIKKADYFGKTDWSDKKGGRNLVILAEKRL